MPLARARESLARRLRKGLMSSGCSSFMRRILPLEAPVEIGELLARADVVPRAAEVLAADAPLVDEAIRPWKKLEPGPRRDAAKHVRMEDGDVAVGEARGSARDLALGKVHVAPGMPRRIVHEHEMRDAALAIARDRLDRAGERRVVEIRVDVGAHDDEGTAAEERQGSRDATGRLERWRLGRIANARPEGGAIAERRLDERAEVRMVHHEVAKAAAHEALDLPGDEGLPPGLEKRLWQLVGEGPQALTAPGGHQQRAAHQNV